MFERCERDGEFKQVRSPVFLPFLLFVSSETELMRVVGHVQAIGIALSSHRLDVVKRVFDNTKDASLLEWVLEVVVREGVAVGGQSRAYKNEVRFAVFPLSG